MDVSTVCLINKYYRDLSYSFIYLLGAEEAVNEQLPSGDESLNLQGESITRFSLYPLDQLVHYSQCACYKSRLI